MIIKELGPGDVLLEGLVRQWVVVAVSSEAEAVTVVSVAGVLDTLAEGDTARNQRIRRMGNVRDIAGGRDDGPVS